MSPIGYTGYGYAGLNILTALQKLSNNIGLTPIGQPHIDTEEDNLMIQTCANQTHLIPYDSPALKIWHQFDLLTRPGSGTYFAFPFFEVDTLNQKEKHHLNFVDHLVVSSDWAKDILSKNGINKPVSVVPLGVDTNIFSSKLDNANKTPNYIFISIGKWEKRKAHDTLIECFNKAFQPRDNVELWLITHNPFLSPQEEAEWIGLIDKSPLKNKIRVFPRLQTHQQLAEVISYANCGVYISRGEGWNLELLETMSMGKPVIATDYSAHTAYCDKDNSFLVDIEETELAIDNKWFFGTSNWAKIGSKQIDQIIDRMRHCYSNKISTNSGGIQTAARLSWENTAKSLTGCMSS